MVLKINDGVNVSILGKEINADCYFYNFSILQDER